MKITIDTDKKIIHIEDNDKTTPLDLYSREAFEAISEQWIKIGWNEKYAYTFTWLGIPIIQLPEDMLRVQEVIYRIRPDVIIETGIAHGGSLIYYASLCKAMDNGRVIGVDIDIRQHNRRLIEDHKLSPFITLIEGDSIDPLIISSIKSRVNPEETTLVILDSCHSKNHVFEELRAYHDLVTPGSYIIATDGIMKELDDTPRGDMEWTWNNPIEAAIQFVKLHPDFVIEQPPWIFNKSELKKNITYWPGAWLRKK